MYEAKYRKYITQNTVRFADPSEILACTAPFGQNVGGVPLYPDGHDFVRIDPSDKHTIVIGPTGCKKSRVIARTAIASVLESGESAIIADPKGELYRSMSQRAHDLGYDLILINLRNPKVSDGWNPIGNIYDYYAHGDTDKAQRAAQDFAASLTSAVSKEDDRYWENISQSFLASILVLYATTVPDKSYYTLRNILPLCYEQGLPFLKTAMNNLDPGSSIAAGLHAVVDIDSERTRSCVYSTLLTMLNGLSQSEDLLNMFGRTSINFAKIASKKTIVFLIYPDEKNSLNFLINTFLTQSYESIVAYCSEQTDEDCCPVRVNYILDEFSNLCRIENFDNRISEARSKNIRYFLFVQSFSQLKQKYQNNADTIMANCGNWILFSSKEISFLNDVRLILGKQVDYNGQERDLMTIDEMQFLRKDDSGAEVLVLHQGLHPYVCKLPDFYSMSIAVKYIPAPIPQTKRSDSPQHVLSPEEWIRKIEIGEFSFPLLKKSLIKLKTA